MQLLLIAGLALAAGIAVGWFLRAVTSWCPHCGSALRCAECNHRPGPRAVNTGPTVKGATPRPRS
jgi:hypothetical protein